MLELQNKKVLVIGLSRRDWAACEFLHRSGAKVVGVDNANNHDLRHRADRLRPLGVKVVLVQLLSQRVKRAFLLGEFSKGMHAAWSVFTPCTAADSLLEAIAEAAKNATSGDVVLLSPACSSWDQFRNHQHRGEVFCQAVKSIGRGVRGSTPNIDGKTVTANH